MEHQGCESIITEEIVCQVFRFAMIKFTIGETEDGKPLCSPNGFAYNYPYKSTTIPVTIQLRDKKLVYIARIAMVENFSSSDFEAFLTNATENLDTSFVATGEIDKGTSPHQYYAVARCDSIQVHEENRRANEMGFIDAQVNLRLLLNNIPDEFLKISTNEGTPFALWQSTRQQARR